MDYKEKHWGQYQNKFGKQQATAPLPNPRKEFLYVTLTA